MGCGFCDAALSNSVGTLVVDCVVKPIGRQLDYVRRFQDNAERFIEKKGELERERARLQHEIEDTERRLLQIEDVVQNLQLKASEALSDMATLEEEIQLNKRCFNWCPNWSWRYQLSKKAMKKSQDISELLEEIKKFGQPGRVGFRAPTTLPTIDFLCSKEFVFSKSSKAAFNQIIEALKDENINMIGLWGMGGVGKTTLACEVGSLAKKLNLVDKKLNSFDKVVITTVSQKPNFERIQDQIAQYIGFDMKNEQGRRSEQELWLRLKKEQRILIILDDIWEHINLKEKIGIPIGGDHKGCKVLLTTRRKRVCQTMKCRPVVQLDCLDNDEAWTLFEKKAGVDDFSDDSIKNLAKEIVKKCGGLPIAIVPLGSAMIDQKSYHEWQAVDQRLRERTLTEIEDIGENNAYVCLEASFDYLKDMVTKTCFLLCSLFPEDYEIYVEDLVRYACGLELCKCIDPIKDFRSKVLASIEILKNSGLLLDSGERHVKMHDVVRQFALWIASSRNDFSFGTVETLPMYDSFKHYTAISFETDQTDELPKGVVFPNLKLLLLGEFMETSSEFFEGMKVLQVCALDHQLISVAAFQFHMNLRTLCLIGCELSDISMLGKLKTLHILSLKGSDITELPTEVGDLEDLRLLDLSNCYGLRRIAANLIRRLSNLEELYLHGCSLLKWATENSTKRESYSSLSELNLLPKLVVISLDISSKPFPDGFVFRRLWSFDVRIGIERETWYQKRDLETCPVSRSLRINKSVDACKQLFEDVESLQLTDVGHQNLVPSLDLGFSKLTSLDLHRCNSMQCLIDASKQQVPITTLSNLRKLSLNDLLELEQLCNGPQPQGFLQKLEEFKLKDSRMRVLFPIAELESIEQEGSSRHLSLQSLKIVEIESSLFLQYIFPMSVANSLGQLHTLKIKDCWSLEGIIQDSQVPYISLQSLREIEVEECNNLRFLFPMSVANSLGQLHTLKIKNCKQMENIIQATQVSNICLLQSLREVWLIDLPQLKGRDVNDIILTQSSLQKLKVHNCPQLTLFIISTIQELVFGKMTYKQLSNLHLCKYEELEQAQTSSQSHLLPICFPNLTLIDILECENLNSLFPIIVAQGGPKNLNVPNLQTLKIERCLGMEEIIQDSQVSNISFQCLREVQVTECNNLKYLFPMCVANNLGQLQILKISHCSQLEDIIQDSEVSISMAQGVPLLFEVELLNLPQLKGGDRNNIVLTSPSLHSLKVKGCPQFTTMPFIVSTNIQALEFSDMITKQQISNVIVPEMRGGTSTSMEYLTISNFEELFDFRYNLSSLKILKLSKLTELRVIWSGPIQFENFQNLTELEVEGCSRLRYIFSPTMARNLRQLWRLVISDCEELEQIIEKDQTSSQHHLQPICFPNLEWIIIEWCENLKCLFPITLADGGLQTLEGLMLSGLSKLEQVFEGDEGNEEKVIRLPQLRFLVLDWLPNPVSFSPVGYHFVFPSLLYLAVTDCPNITTRFSVDSEESVHGRTQASQSIDEIIVEESATAEETAWPIGSAIRWRRKR